MCPHKLRIEPDGAAKLGCRILQIAELSFRQPQVEMNFRRRLQLQRLTKLDRCRGWILLFQEDTAQKSMRARVLRIEIYCPAQFFQRARTVVQIVECRAEAEVSFSPVRLKPD